MIKRGERTYSTDEENNMMYLERLIDWINSTDKQLFYYM